MSSVISRPEQLDASVATPQSLHGVAFLCHPYHRGGVTRWMADAAVEFARRGVPTWFVVPEPRRPFRSGGGQPTMTDLLQRAVMDQGVRLVAPLVGTTFELGTRGYRTAVYAHALVSHVPRATPVIVSDDDDVWAAASCASDAHPMIGVLHADDPKYYRLASRYASQMAACVAVSKRIARNAQSHVAFPIETIPCGVPLPSDTPVQGRYSRVARLIWVGRLEEEQKRVSDLPRIAARLREQGVPFVLELVGDGPERRHLQREIEQLGLQSEVQFASWLSTDAIWQRMRSSDVLLLPSNYEGMPVVVMEALAAGCAVVASRVSGVEDAAEEPDARDVLFTHDVGDTEAAIGQIARALAIPEQDRRRMARGAAERLYSIQVSVDRYVEVVQRLGVPRTSSRPRMPGLMLNRAVAMPLAHARYARRALMRRGKKSAR